MPRVGINKYEKEKLEECLKAVSDGMPIKTASRKFGVPRSTLQFRLKHPDCKKNGVGPAPIIAEEEPQLVEWILRCAEKGFPLNKHNILRSVQEFLNQSPRRNPFPNNLPGEGWYKAFLKRNPCINRKTNEAVPDANECGGESDIKRWFTTIKKYLASNGLMDILQDPSRVFTGHETSFQLFPTTDSTSSGDSMSAMFTLCASGEVAPPMIVYPWSRLSKDAVASTPLGWNAGQCNSGWMKADFFYEYITNILYPYLELKNTCFPIIFFVDGQNTHLTYQLSELCCELQIELIALYPNATKMLQLADVESFRAVKAGWKDAVGRWRLEHPLEPLTRAHIASLLKTVADTHITPLTIKNSFRACGLFPFNPKHIGLLPRPQYNYREPKPSCQSSSSAKESASSAYECNNTVLSCSEFEDIVGEELIDKFCNIKTPDVLTEKLGNDEFFVIYRLWKRLQDKKAASSRPNTSKAFEIAIQSKAPSTDLEVS